MSLGIGRETSHLEHTIIMRTKMDRLELEPSETGLTVSFRDPITGSYFSTFLSATELATLATTNSGCNAPLTEVRA